MNAIQASLLHKVIEPRRRGTPLAPALILLHGRGADEEDLLGLAEYLDERFFIICPRAPFAFKMGGGYTWYDLEEIGKPDPEMFRASYEKVVHFTNEVRAGYPVDPENVFIGGFSMGTVMSYALALTHPSLVRGVVANSGYIPEETDLTFSWSEMKSKPVLVTHGTYDPVIPVSFGHRAKDLLSKAGAALTYREYDMGHQIGEESLNDMMQWLSGQLGTP